MFLFSLFHPLQGLRQLTRIAAEGNVSRRVSLLTPWIVGVIDVFDPARSNAANLDHGFARLHPVKVTGIGGHDKGRAGGNAFSAVGSNCSPKPM